MSHSNAAFVPYSFQSAKEIVKKEHSLLGKAAKVYSEEKKGSSKVAGKKSRKK